MSGVGKGVSVASIGAILKASGFRVTAVKIDPYINVDAGTMNPTEHGEVFVTEDGDETDQDIGHYERFLDQNIPTENYMTTGRVYLSVIKRERNLKYKGACVEVVPHIPEEVIRRIERAGKKAKADFVIVEIGGTVGEYQNILFLEAYRMLKNRKPAEVILFLVSFLPIPSKIGEMKTKPTQNAVRQLNAAGIQPDFILARSEKSLDRPRIQKLATFCNILEEHAISAQDVDNVYLVPLNFEKGGLAGKVLRCFDLKPRKANLQKFRILENKIKKAKKKVRIGIVGKYFGSGDFTLSDSYISVIEAIKHAAWYFDLKPSLSWLSSESYENNQNKLSELKKFDGIVVPGGFGSRGVEGKILAIEYVRKNKIPYLGLCYGMQLLTVEFARNVCGMKNAHTTEIAPKTKFPVIDIMKEQKSKIKNQRYGGTMRLGGYKCRLKNKTIAKRAYGKKVVIERHRHRYEFNPKYRRRLAGKGLQISGVNPETGLVEIVEVKNHPFCLGTQFHPEFTSRPLRPNPIFREFIKTASGS